MESSRHPSPIPTLAAENARYPQYSRMNIAAEVFNPQPLQRQRSGPHDASNRPHSLPVYVHGDSMNGHEAAQGRMAMPNMGGPPMGRVVGHRPQGVPSHMMNDEYISEDQLNQMSDNSPLLSYHGLPAFSPANELRYTSGGQVGSMAPPHLPTQSGPQRPHMAARSHTSHHPSQSARPAPPPRYPSGPVRMHHQAIRDDPFIADSHHELAYHQAANAPVPMMGQAGPSNYNAHIPQEGFRETLTPNRLWNAPRFSPHNMRALDTPSTAAAPSSSPNSSPEGTVTASGSSTQARTVRNESEIQESPTTTGRPKTAPTHLTSGADSQTGPRPKSSIPTTKSAVIGGRTSSKFAKVAEDPGVEGVPDGPRPETRPTVSFACIIGESILKSKAGGLSLEHIYRYVETMYPFFKPGDPAWRNSVRHNLSIHKMFNTTARTEKYPPGKGGIWVIHEDEKCHWPFEGKFIKNFPEGHAHYDSCRQVKFDKGKEEAGEAKEKAKCLAEGRPYIAIPKKGKKGKKLGGATEMERSSSAISDTFDPAPEIPVHNLVPHPYALQQFDINSHMMHPGAMRPDELAWVPEEEADHYPFLPMMPEPPQPQTSPTKHAMESHGVSLPLSEINMPLAPQKEGIMAPPRPGAMKRDRRLTSDDDAFLGDSFRTKRVRVAEFQGGRALIPGTDARSYITPERPMMFTGEPTTSTSKLHGSFRTPALIADSSSPGSSPMPLTLPRAGTYMPSRLHHRSDTDFENDDDHVDSLSSELDTAFEFAPKHDRKLALVEEEIVNCAVPHLLGPPRTPVARSSAAQENRPMFKTPISVSPAMIAGSPHPLAENYEVNMMSTPAWELQGVLARMKARNDAGVSPKASPMGAGRGVTSPKMYSMELTSPSRRNASADTVASKA